MSEATLLQTVRESAEARKILERYFDFVPVPLVTRSELFQFRKGTDYELIGKDGSGGEFVLCDGCDSTTRPMLYVSSEGQAGVIGRSLESGLSCIIELPYWQDCLKFSGDGQLAEMRRVVPFSESDLIAETPQIASIRDILRKVLGLSQISDSIQELHSAVTELSALYTVCAPDGWQYGPLFGKYTVMSNGAWRRKLTAP